ncbi:TonB-dependent receptor [Kriegella aquimaris]|uniref:Outer membrane receptor for ferrienterochelin and colicins n=1 Tax=Kriegella aquimaris TaxID=192904 RepID=A0A1G9W0R6_9FLAO|nr:carboxypeptidase-like regulatory domain-containing protein [Kriegella aquimaris]SDM77817.1 Outer membrane receptor for ferrienterochelin and colicins [Kriegella aquimaris]
MLKTLRKRVLPFLCPMLFFISSIAQAQENTATTYLSSYIQLLEQDFDVKFSYIDDDLRTIQITIPKSSKLSEILEDIRDQTQIEIQKLSERYYTLKKTTTVHICAIILDNFENNTVAGATVEVLQSNVASVTDLDGKFSFANVPRSATIQIRHIGYKTLFVNVEDLLAPNCPTLLLAVNYQLLDEVVVYKFLTTGLTKELDASVTMNTKEFGLLPGLTEPDVLQTVQALPGIKSIDETVSDINIRGGTNDQNLILWDGIKMYQSGHFFGLISAFNPYLTDKVVLVKNGTSAQYGDGVSGIISMQTANQINAEFTGGGGFNLIGGDVYGQFPLSEKLALQFSARRSLTDFFNTPTYNQFFERAFQDSEVSENSYTSAITKEEDFYFYDFSAKLLYDITAKQKFRFSLININNDLNYTETDTGAERTSNSELNQSNLSFGGSLESQWTPKFSTHLNIYYTSYMLNALSNTSSEQQQLFQNNEVLETSIKLNTHYTLSNTLSWLNGYQLSETGIINATNVTQPPFKSDVKGVMRTYALYSELTFTPKNKKWFARGGARLNYLENIATYHEFIIEPRLNINYSFTENIKAEFMGEFKSQATNQVVDLEQNFLGIEKRRWILSDGEALPITKSKQGSAGINYDHENLYIGVEGFYKEVTGISTATQGFQNQNQFNGELGKYDVKGIEFLINKKSTDYSTWLSYTYNQNNYTFNETTPRTFPNNLDVRHSITLAGNYTFNRLKFSMGLNYRTGKPFTEPQSDDPIDATFFPYRINYASANSSRLPEYFRADVSAVYNFSINSGIKASIGLSVLNFTDRKNTLNTYYRLNENDEIETVKSVSLGLTPNASFRINF